MRFQHLSTLTPVHIHITFKCIKKQRVCICDFFLFWYDVYFACVIALIAGCRWFFFLLLFSFCVYVALNKMRFLSMSMFGRLHVLQIKQIEYKTVDRYVCTHTHKCTTITIFYKMYQRKVK